jgi:hypothetical protein
MSSQKDQDEAVNCIPLNYRFTPPALFSCGSVFFFLSVSSKRYTTTWMNYIFDGKANTIGKQDYDYSTSLRNDIFLEHLTPFKKVG